MLRAAVPGIFCLLVFFFALHAKTAVYGGTSQTKITPSTASKMWAGAQKIDAHTLAPQSTPLFWLLFLSVLGLGLSLSRPQIPSTQIIPPPGNPHLRNLHRFLRPPPSQN
jgi:hypothetical protein